MALPRRLCAACACWAGAALERGPPPGPLLTGSDDAAPDAQPFFSLVQSGVAVTAPQASRPWDHHLYLVGTRHKAGSHLLRNIMHTAFTILGAKLSCQEGSEMDSVITRGGKHKCYKEPEIPIHWTNSLTAQDIQENREIAGQRGMRAVQIIRDPLKMVASDYCYHHMGREMGQSKYAPLNITKLTPEEGVPAVARSMFKTVEDMVDAYTASSGSPDVLTVRFEDLTESSAGFDSAVARMFDFLFGPYITPEEMRRIRRAARAQDLRRGRSLEQLLHSNNDRCSKRAAAALGSVDGELLARYRELRRRAGYA